MLEKNFVIKVVRLIRVIVHVLWGCVQVFFLIDEKKSIGEKEQQLICQWFRNFLKILNIKQQIHGEMSANKHLVVANHISWKDIIVLNSAYATRFVAMSEIRKWPVAGWLSYRAGTLFVKRGSMTDARRLNKEITHLLSSGQSITIFPEGVTSVGNDIAHLYPGLFQSAIDAKIGIQPVVIIYRVNEKYSADVAYTDDTSLLKNLWMVLGLENLTVDIYFTELIRTENMTRKELSLLSYQQMKDCLQNNI
ncbi:MAG: 1-acyl-sn-glycerol-3-phosphate acyltransferase [gamma proteobacterium symbiont of Taylorina sp.]|nr:1-acyl-sn-glycerol-3-phosphate acyltransferase [gamma proteobacterium symbiont of Taylorina sp.]